MKEPKKRDYRGVKITLQQGVNLPLQNTTDLDVIDKPRVMGVKRACILAVLACIATLIKKLLHFIINITLTLRKAIKTSDPQRKYWKALRLRAPPACIANIINKA